MELIQLISSNLTQMVNITTRIPDTVLLFWIYLFLDASICSTTAFPPLRNSDNAVISVSTIDFPLYSQWDTPFHHIAYNYSCADWDSLSDHLRDVPWENIFKLSTSAAASEF